MFLVQKRDFMKRTSCNNAHSTTYPFVLADRIDRAMKIIRHKKLGEYWLRAQKNDLGFS
jgi:hypothetical protein